MSGIVNEKIEATLEWVAGHMRSLKACAQSSSEKEEFKLTPEAEQIIAAVHGTCNQFCAMSVAVLHELLPLVQAANEDHLPTIAECLKEDRDVLEQLNENAAQIERLRQQILDFPQKIAREEDLRKSLEVGLAKRNGLLKQAEDLLSEIEKQEKEIDEEDAQFDAEVAKLRTEFANLQARQEVNSVIASSVGAESKEGELTTFELPDDIDDTFLEQQE